MSCLALQAASSSSGRVDPKAEAEAENMAKLLLEEEEQVRRIFTLLTVGSAADFDGLRGQEVKQGLKGNKKPAAKKKKK